LEDSAAAARQPGMFNNWAYKRKQAGLSKATLKFEQVVARILNFMYFRVIFHFMLCLLESWFPLEVIINFVFNTKPIHPRLLYYGSYSPAQFFSVNAIVGCSSKL
jgi:hypothetical protein